MSTEPPADTQPAEQPAEPEQTKRTRRAEPITKRTATQRRGELRVPRRRRPAT